jgi:D-serine deaminase-like pyridoxal phosphate-dependent protein
MKLAFLVLLLANVALFAWRSGVLGAPPDGGREPQRLARQVAPEKIRMLSPEQLAALRGMARAEADARPACIEFGDFDEASVARAQARLAVLALGERLQAKRVETRGGYIVYLPPQASRADADRLAQELRGRGVRDLVVLGENSLLPNAVLLGSFRDQELAQRHQADLERRGFKGVRLAERPGAGEAMRFEIREVDAPLAQQLAEIQKEFPQSQLGACANQ